jgi:hypothetical protein
VWRKPRVFDLRLGEDPAGGPDDDDLIVGYVVIGFRVEEGRLEEGDTVTIHIGREAGFTWKKLSGRKEFKVIVEPRGGEPKQRLPAPVRIEIRPRGPERLEVHLPGSASPGEPLEAWISLRDRYDNRVPWSGPVSVRVDGEDHTAHLHRGLGAAPIGKMRDRPLWAAAGATVVSGSFSSNPCVPAAGEHRLYFGDLHTHDFFSSAEAYPADCYLWARDEKRLDFQSLPVQIHRWVDNEKWAIVKHLCEYFLDEGRFVTILAFEWQHSEYGDKVIHYLGGDMPYLPVDDPRYSHPAGLYEALRGTDAIVISHHPGYDLGLHVPGARWEAMETDVDRLVEIWSMHGSSEGFDEKDRPMIPPTRPGGVYGALRSGLRLGITGGSDTHTGRPGGSCDDVRPYHGGLCGIWARQLSRRGLFEALRARRTYALTGSRIALEFSVNGAPMGCELPVSDRCVVEARVAAPGDLRCVQFLRDTELLLEVSAEGRLFHHVFEDEPVSGRGFYSCRVLQRDGHLAVCTPVWVG